MKALFIPFSLIVLSLAILYNSQTGRYQITPVSGLAGVYMIDTRTSEISICSPLHSNGCITIEDAYRDIEARKEKALSTVENTGNKINEFTKKRAGELNNILKKIEGDE